LKHFNCLLPPAWDDNYSQKALAKNKIKTKQDKALLLLLLLIQSNPAKQASGKKLDTIWRTLHHRHTFSSSQDPQETNCDEPKPDQKKNKNKRNLKSKEPAKKTLEKKSRKNQEKIRKKQVEA
jgi:hypothetical protein